MTKMQLVLGLKKRLVDSTLAEYEDRFLLVANQSEASTDDLDFAGLFESLPERQRTILLRLVRQVEVDTVADFMAFLDGIYWIEGQSEDMKLVNLENPEVKLNEELTDTFLNLVHKWDR